VKPWEEGGKVMTQFKVFIALVISALLACTLVRAQQPEVKPLTNADVVAMVKAGLPESTIVLTIQRSPSRFNVSPEALIELKNQSVTQKIMDAMLSTQTASSQVPPQEPDSSVPGLPNEQGAYYEGPAGFVRLERVTARARTRGEGKGLLTMGLSGMQFVAAYRGARAPVQVTEPKPTFYVRAPAELSTREIQIVRLETKKDRREVQTASGTILSTKVGYREKDLRKAIVKQLGAGLFEVAPESELAPGEYLLDLSGLTYDFGISSTK